MLLAANTSGAAVEFGVVGGMSQSGCGWVRARGCNRVETGGNISQRQLLSKKYVLLSTDNLSNKCSVGVGFAPYSESLMEGWRDC